MKAPYATTAIILVAVAAYLIASGGNLYVPSAASIFKLGAWKTNTFGALTYAFMHIGFKHLLINMAILFAVGWVAESRIGWKHTLALFLFSSTLAGIAYTIAMPATWVVGSSAGIAGLLVAAYLADVKKALLVLFSAILFTYFIALPLTDYTVDYLTTSHERVLNETTQEMNALSDELEQVEMQIREKEARGENITQELQVMVNLSARLNQTAAIKEQAQEEKETLEKGAKKEEETPASDLIHMFGALAGILYMGVFKREAFEWFLNDLLAAWDYAKAKTGVRKHANKR